LQNLLALRLEASYHTHRCVDSLVGVNLTGRFSFRQQRLSTELTYFVCLYISISHSFLGIFAKRILDSEFGFIKSLIRLLPDVLSRFVVLGRKFG
jgi:hypothetical protein